MINEVLNAKSEEALEKYRDRYNNRVYQKAIYGFVPSPAEARALDRDRSVVKRANLLVDCALALCGDAQFQCRLGKISSDEEDFLELFC